MFVSMTGFAQREFDLQDRKCLLLIKSYNNRYLDLSISLPPAAAALEPRIQELLASKIARGKVECSIRFKGAAAGGAIEVDEQRARSVCEALSKISRACGLSEAPSLATIASFEGVFSGEPESAAETLWPRLELELLAALEDFGARRLQEGEATGRSLEREMERLKEGLAFVEGKSAQLGEILKRQMTERFDELLQNPVDPDRLLQEIAIQVVRYGINEEIVRLKAHFAAFDEIAARSTPAKKLDFLCQEMNREINTIGSKNTLAEVAHRVVDMKDALENIREQLRNLE